MATSRTPAKRRLARTQAVTIAPPPILSRLAPSRAHPEMPPADETAIYSLISDFVEVWGMCQTEIRHRAGDPCTRAGRWRDRRSLRYPRNRVLEIARCSDPFDHSRVPAVASLPEGAGFV